MKNWLTVFIFSIATSSFAQTNNPWGKWSWLIGEWQGTGMGNPGKGGGNFSFETSLDDKILMRKSHAVYSGHGGTTHDDLMIIYTERPGFPAKAIYFDNEGHTINYNIAYVGKSIIFTSGKVKDIPFFKLTYTQIDSGKVNTRFEMSQDGAHFTPYVVGDSKKIK